jgi:signal transduction histidine kinase
VMHTAGPVGALVCDVPEGGAGGDAVAVMAGLAGHVAVAIELESARSDRERLLLADERERIARDLHDHAVQALFATGLSLQSILPMVANDRVAGRVHEAIDSLDATIKQIRTAIFTLSAPSEPGSGLRASIVRLAAEASRGLGFDPSVTFDGGVDTSVPSEVAGQVEAVVRESLSNIGRHAQASSASIVIRVAGGRCTVEVADDGIGIDDRAAAGVGSGLRNLRTRADRLGGGFALEGGPGEGTRLTWWVPIR